MLSQADIIEAFTYLEQMVFQIYPFKFRKQINWILKPPFGAWASITNDIVSSNYYDKHIDFNFETCNLQFLHREVPPSPSYGAYISHFLQRRVLSVLTFRQDHTGQCKSTGVCYNELVVAIFRTSAGIKGTKIYTC